MSNINEYMTQEVVVDYADGLISRREAVRRLSLLGVGAAVALPLLAACDAQGEGEARQSAGPPTSPPAPSGSAPAGPAPLATTAITFAGRQGQLQGAWAEAAEP